MTTSEDVLARAARIRVLLMDVDGVLTDGTYYQVPDGAGGLAETKGFDSQDGLALPCDGASGAGDADEIAYRSTGRAAW